MFLFPVSHFIISYIIRSLRHFLIQVSYFASAQQGHSDWIYDKCPPKLEPLKSVSKSIMLNQKQFVQSKKNMWKVKTQWHVS